MRHAIQSPHALSPSYRLGRKHDVLTGPEMEVLVLGGGSPLWPGRHWSNILLGRRILLEAPPSLPIRLHELGVASELLDAIVISHLHGDHFAGLVFMLLEFYAVSPRSRPLVVMGPKGIRARIAALCELCYPGLRGLTESAGCEFRELGHGDATQVGPHFIEAVEVDHGLIAGEALGYRISSATGVVGFTGDTRWCDALMRLAENADLLIVDCTFANRRSGATHLSLEELRELRHRLPSSVRLLATHQGAEIAGTTAEGILLPADGERIVLQCAGH